MNGELIVILASVVGICSAAAGFRAAALILILVLATGPGSYAIAYTIAISIFASVVVQVVGIS